ncbi:MAG TPA: YihY family inner membrane protein [Burkholderiales bacterium]|nr:YihY family inner membrane protein [Burkholderiales bacterium]
MNRNSWRSALREFLDFSWAMVQRFRDERATQTAGSLAYTSLLSMVPLLTVALAIASAFPVFENAVDSLQNFLFENVLPDAPGLEAIMDQLDSFTRNAGKLTAIGIIGFMVTSVMLMLTVDNALNRIFRVQRRRSLVQNVFVYWAVLTLGPVLIGVSLSMTTVGLGTSLGSDLLDMMAAALLRALPFIFTCAALALLYGVVPARRVAFRHAVTGGIVAGIGFEVAKRAFALYLQQVPTYALIYGAFATIPIFLVWLYVSWVVVLAGAVFTAMLPAYRAKPEQRMAPGERLAEVLGALSILAHAHEEGRVVSLNAIARALRTQPYRCEEVLVRAAARGWVARTEKDGWVLARDAESIRVADLYHEFVFDSGAVGVAESDLGLSLQEYAARGKG